MKHITSLTAIIFFIFGHLSVFATEKEKSVNTKESKILWVGSKPGGLHNGVVLIKEGKLVVNSKSEVTGGEFIIDFATIENYDLSNEEMNRKLVDHLKSEDFFDIVKHPTGKFVLTSVEKLKQPLKKDGLTFTHKVAGSLTVKGITKPVSFHATITVKGDKVEAVSEKITLDRTEWDITYQSKKIFANLKDQFIHDEMVLSVNLVTK